MLPSPPGQYTATRRSVGLSAQSGPQWTAPSINMTVRCVCHNCNSGWMARLESQAEPVLTPMILGTPTPHALDPPAQLLVATWATKTSYVFECVFDEGHRTSSAADRRFLMERLMPPPSVRVRIAAYEGPRYPVNYFRRVGLCETRFPHRLMSTSISHLRRRLSSGTWCFK